MKWFWFTKPKQTARYHRINKWFIFMIAGFFLVFSLITRMQNVVFAWPTQDIFEQDIWQLALYLSTYDNRAASVLLSVQRVTQWYKNKDFLKTYQWDIENILQYLSNNPDTFSQMWLQEYKPFLEFVAGLSAQKTDIFSLLGKEKPQTYIIALQNAAEKRPNGWFFGSFVKVTLEDAKITDLKFIDSYVPGILKPDVSLQAPNWSQTFLSGDDRITFLASNKFGFTDIDGKNIKKLYDMTYNEDIRGVMFLNSNLFAYLLPWFQEQLWEWQFKNASIDLIRWQALPNKKELYFNGVNELLKTRKNDLIKAIAKHFDLIQKNRFVQAYIVRTSPELTSFLQKEWLQTVFNKDTIYLWDYNSSYNKIDTFIEKNTTIINENGVIVKESNQDVISIKNLPVGKYTLHMKYTMNIPISYTTYIENLAKQFGITLQVREKHILALYPEWSTRWVVYTPENIILAWVEWPVKQKALFTSPFSNNAFYVLENTVNNSMKEVAIPFTIK